MKKIKIIVACLLVFFMIIFPALRIIDLSSTGNPEEISNETREPHSSDITTTKQWITNGDFSSKEDWIVVKGEDGDPNDVDASISNETANYQVLGFEDRFTFEEKYYMGTSWIKTNHPDFPIDPSSSSIVAGEGFKAGHSWDDQNANQVPSVQWERNFSLPVNMSDYIITSASVSAGINATVNSNIDTFSDNMTGKSARTGGYDVDTYSVGDYIRFYVSISNLQKTKTHEIAYTQSATLGDGDAGSTDNLAQQLMSTVSQTDLIYYISSVLETDYRNFTLIVGIRFNCEDNVATFYDLDDFNRAVINSINLTFTYEKNIDQLTSISWKQVGDIPSDISDNPIVINGALLNFQYKVNDTWPIMSPNSEFRILINDVQHSETVKLSQGITTFKDAKTGGFDVTYLINKEENVSLSLRIYLADEFKLDRYINISIDNVYLNITYTEIIEDIETDYELYLNSQNKTLDPAISIPLGEDLNITIKYLENQTRNHISGATVQLEGKVSGNLTENFSLQHYNITINTNDLGIGVKTLTVVAVKNDYVEQSIPFFVEVTERETNLLLFLDSDPKNDGDTIQAKANELINVTVYYRDDLTNQSLNGATVTLLGDLTGDLDETSGIYNITIDTDDLDQGINAFTVFAQLQDYMPQSIQFFVELIERETELLLYLNGVPKNDKAKIEVQVDEVINVTVYYKDNITKQLLSGATVTLLGIDNLTETPSHYNITIDTSDLDPGITVLTVFAQLDNYRSQSIQFFVEIVNRETELLLFLNGVPKNDSDKIKVEVNEFINITVYYKDNLTKQFLSGASVTLLGVDNLTETPSHYNITINTNNLDQGISILTIFAQLDNYQPQTIRFIVEVVERESKLELFLNGEDMTSDPVIDVVIGTLLNITVYYTDNQTGLPIAGALVKLIPLLEEGATIEFNETLNQYSILLNTSELNVYSVNRFSIEAYANNFKIKTIDNLRITVNRIGITPSILLGESYLTGFKGDVITLSIILNDTNVLPYGKLIKNANITFEWYYGVGKILDPENDGIYEVDLDLNVPVDTYIIYIRVLDEFDEYVFEYNSENAHEITLNVNPRQGLDLTWLVIIISSALIGLVVIFGLYQKHFKYPPLVRKIRKLRKKIRRGRKVKPIGLYKREDIVNENFKAQIQPLELKPIKSEKDFKVQMDSKIEKSNNLQNGGI